MANTNRRDSLRTSLAAAAVATPLNAAQDNTDSAQLASRLNHDLHTHTVFSDGAHSVALHVLEARAFELEAVMFPPLRGSTRH